MLKLQSIINYLYRYPKGSLKNIQRFGGYFSYRKMFKDKKIMLVKAKDLLPTTSYKDGLQIYFLTGKNYLYQTLYCIKSLTKFCDKKFEFVLVDDGSFDQKIINQINDQLPNAKVITKEEIDKNLEKIIPASKYPNLHRKRKEYPHIKKLTDIHTLPGNWKLVLDSDMLFWGNPVEMISWLENPTNPIHMVDCQQSYGYSISLMKKLCNYPIPSLVNVGIIGLNSNEINWNNVENWIGTLEELEGKSYFLEQAISAMILASKESLILKEAKYIVNPGKIEAIEKSGYLHHYVDLSKAYYFSNAYKNF